MSALGRFVAPSSLYCWDASTAAPVRRYATELQAAGIKTWLGAPPALSGPLGSCAVIKSPGIPFSAPLIQQAQERGLDVLDEFELGWRLAHAPILAVTGTNGKSTMCSLVAAVASASGLRAPVAGNSQFGLPLSSAANAPGDLIICEVSSFQLEGCSAMLPEVAVLTNIRPDHLNRHGSFDAYAACKWRLFTRGDQATSRAVLNLDDDRGAQLASEVRALGGTSIGYGRAPGATFRVRRCGWDLSSGWIDLDTPTGAITVNVALPGPHNAANVAGAMAAAHSLGFEHETIVESIERTPGLPGRFEQIDEGQPFAVIVDFAHTPDAISAVIETARAAVGNRPGARLHVLASVAGHRSRELSSPMGEAAARLADRVVLTEGSSYRIARERVMAPLVEGARSVGDCAVEVVPNRRAAIRQLLASAASGDVVLVLGRGALSHLQRANRVTAPFDDRTVVRSELRAIAAAWRGRGAARSRSRSRAPRRSRQSSR